MTIAKVLKLKIPDPELMNTDPSSYWKVLVDQFLMTLDQNSVDNFKLAADKFEDKDTHLYVKDVPWFKNWWKEVQDLLGAHNIQKKD